MPVYKYFLANGDTRYMVKVSHRNTQHKKMGFRTKHQAEAYERDKKDALITGLVSSNTTFEQASGYWLEYKKKRCAPSTIKGYETQLRLRILPAIGKKGLGGITPLELQTLLDSCPSPRLTNKCRVVIGSIYKSAVGWGLTKYDPTRALHGLQEKKREMRFLTTGEAQALLFHFSTFGPVIYFYFTSLALATGMRVGELFALEWLDIDEEHISVTKSWGSGKMGPPKGKRPREVIIPPSVFKMLMRYYLECGRPSPSSPVFLRDNGKRLEVWVYRYQLDKAVKAIEMEHVRPHDLRHTYAAWCIAGNINPKFIQKQLGHSSILITMDTYGHIMKDLEEHYIEWAEKQIVPNLYHGIPSGFEAFLESGNGKVIYPARWRDKN